MSLVGVRPDHDTSRPAGAAAALRTPPRSASAAQDLLDRARAGDSRTSASTTTRLDAAAADVADVTRARYPELRIPQHSRWRHFDAGGVDRKAELDRGSRLRTRRRARAP